MASVTIKDRAMDMEIQQVPWWNRRTRMERRFFILSITLLLTTIGLSIALAGVIYRDFIIPGYSQNELRLDYVRSDSVDADNFESPSKQRLKVVKEVQLGNGKRVTRLTFLILKTMNCFNDRNNCVILEICRCCNKDFLNSTETLMSCYPSI